MLQLILKLQRAGVYISSILADIFHPIVVLEVRPVVAVTSGACIASAEVYKIRQCWLAPLGRLLQAPLSDCDGGP